MAYGDLTAALRGAGARLAAAFGCLAAVLLIAAAAPPAARAQAPAFAAPREDVFTARVPVSGTGSTAMQARDRAMQQANPAGLQQVLRRLTRRSDWSLLPRPPADALVDAVQSFELRDERGGGTRYAATVVIHFRPSMVRDMLRRANVAFTETASRPVLVLPVFERGGTRTLFEDDGSNPWRDAWAKRDPYETLVPLLVPQGDLSDRAALTADQAVAGDRDRIMAVADRYGVAEVIVARAAYTVDPRGGTPVMDVTATRFGADAAAPPVSERVAGKAGDAVEAIADRAAEAIAFDVDDAWKAVTIVATDQPAETLDVMVPLSGIGDLVAVRRRLTGVAAVQGSDFRALERTGAFFRLSYVGGIDRLRLAFAQSGLQLVQDGERWQLRASSPGAR